MALDRLEVRVSITKILIALIVVIVPLSIVGLILTARSDKALDTAIGNDFKTVADMYSNEVSQFVRDRVADVNIMAAEPCSSMQFLLPIGKPALSLEQLLPGKAAQTSRQRGRGDNCGQSYCRLECLGTPASPQRNDSPLFRYSGDRRNRCSCRGESKTEQSFPGTGTRLASRVCRRER